MEVSTLFKIDNNPKVVALASILAVALVATVTARPPADRHETNAATLSVDNTTYVNANNILMFVTNHGNFGRDLSDYFGNDYGTYFPFSHEGDISSGANVLSVLYAGGLWLGGVDAATGDTLVVISDYSSEYVPGPMAGGTYQSDRPEYRVYKLYGDSLAGNPNQDYLNWPTDQGAPVNGPGFALSDSDQATWCVYNDANPSQHSIMQTDPIGVEIHQTVSAGDVSSGPAASSVFLTYKIINKGGKRLNDFMISLWLDPDVGGSSDDMVGCDILDNVFYCYNATNNDQYYSMYPPAVGVKLLEGPVVPSPGKTGTVGGVPIADHRNLGLYSIVYYTNGTDPDNYEETYQYMHGLQASRAGAPPYQYMGHSTRFWLSGDPVAGTGDLDPSGDDKRIMGTLEPFDFLPGDTQQVTFVLAAGHGGSRLISLTILRSYLNFAGIPTDVGDGDITTLPEEFSVDQNYPNPFNPATTISYSLPERAEVEIAIFNVMGQTVATLDEGSQPAGDHSVVWKGVDDSGNSVATGVYFYRITAGDNVSTKKMLLLK